MNEYVLVFGAVLGAAVFVLWRILPPGIKAVVSSDDGSSCSTGACGSKNCKDGGCH